MHPHFQLQNFGGEKFVKYCRHKWMAIWAIPTGSWHVWKRICPCSIDDTLKQGN